MARTSSSLVEGIIEVDSDISLTPFINAANLLVTQCCTNLSSEYTSDQLTEIETWLAAHFYTVRDMRIVSEKAGDVSAKYQSKVDIGFNTSHYGQMAMRLDFKGGLAALDKKTSQGKRKPVSVNWLGTTTMDSTS